MKENMMFYGVTLSQRYTLKQKECFLEEVIKKCKDNGYKTSFISKHGSYYQLANLVIGDLDKAKTIVCASYDTPRKSLIPVNYYPFAAKNNVSMGKKNVIVDAVIMIIMFLLSYVILLNFNEASTSIKSLKIIMLAVLIIFTFFVLKGTANKVNFSRNSAAVAMVMELMENNLNPSVAYVLLDRNTVTYEGLKALKEKLQDTSKEIILLDALAYGKDTCIAYNKNVDISDFEVLDFIEESNGNEYKLKVFGQFDAHSKYDFIQMSIMYSSSKVMFNELTEVSWFEDKRFFLQQ